MSSKCKVCDVIEQGRENQRKRVGCDLCKNNTTTYRFEHLGGPLAVWFCARCYEVLTGVKP